jgi:hypothetical protein
MLLFRIPEFHRPETYTMGQAIPDEKKKLFIDRSCN